MKYALLALMLLATPAFAEISGSVGGTSQYVWRGVSQGEDPAVQVSLTASGKSGLYGTFWASQVDFGTDAHTEANYMVGFQRGWLDVGYLQYDYWGDEVELADEMKEVYVGVKAGPFFGYVFHNPDAGEYWNVGAQHDFSKFSVKGWFGHDDNKDHAGVTVSKDFGPVNVGYTFDHVSGNQEHSVGVHYNF